GRRAGDGVVQLAPGDRAARHQDAQVRRLPQQRPAPDGTHARPRKVPPSPRVYAGATTDATRWMAGRRRAIIGGGETVSGARMDLDSCCIVNGGGGAWAFDALAHQLSAALWLDVSETPRRY